VFVLPGLLFAGIGLHLYLVLRHGVSEPPRAGRPVDPRTYRSWYERLLRCDGVPFWPNAAWRDLVFGSVVVGAVVALGWAVGPPGLGRPPDPSVINAEPRPDWYFLPYFALLALMPHSLEPFVIVLGPLVLGVVLVSVPLLAHRGERSPKRRPWAPMIVLGAATVLTALGVAGMKADWSPRFDAKPLPAALVAPSDPRVNRGAALFARRGCIYCHAISTHGGRRGPNLTHVGSLLTRDQMVIRILNGGYNMPGYGAILQADEVDALIGFLQSRR
jgi:ubiquinol-cytochrome c reductase cytochrome b subunit